MLLASWLPSYNVGLDIELELVVTYFCLDISSAKDMN